MVYRVPRMALSAALVLAALPGSVLAEDKVLKLPFGIEVQYTTKDDWLRQFEPESDSSLSLVGVGEPRRASHEVRVARSNPALDAAVRAFSDRFKRLAPPQRRVAIIEEYDKLLREGRGTDDPYVQALRGNYYVGKLCSPWHNDPSSDGVAPLAVARTNVTWTPSVDRWNKFSAESWKPLQDQVAELKHDNFMRDELAIYKGWTAEELEAHFNPDSAATRAYRAYIQESGAAMKRLDSTGWPYSGWPSEEARRRWFGVEKPRLDQMLADFVRLRDEKPSVGGRTDHGPSDPPSTGRGTSQVEGSATGSALP